MMSTKDSKVEKLWVGITKRCPFLVSEVVPGAKNALKSSAIVAASHTHREVLQIFKYNSAQCLQTRSETLNWIFRWDEAYIRCQKFACCTFLSVFFHGLQTVLDRQRDNLQYLKLWVSVLGIQKTLASFLPPYEAGGHRWPYAPYADPGRKPHI